MNLISVSFETCTNLARKNFKENDMLKYNIPALTLLAGAAFCLPNTLVGIATGASLVVPKLIILRKNIKFPLVKTVYINDGMNTEKYNRFLTISQTILGPVQEEIVFRHVFQRLLSHSITWLIPSASIALFGPIFTAAMISSIFTTAIVFGLIHNFRADKAIIISGVAYGVLAASFGLHVSIAAHMTQNTLVCALEGLFCGDEIRYIKL